MKEGFHNPKKIYWFLRFGGSCGKLSLIAKAENLQSDTVRVAVVGMGGRGTGAIGQILDAPKDLAKDKTFVATPKLVAVADAFPKSPLKNRCIQEKVRRGSSRCRRAVFSAVLTDTNRPSTKMLIWLSSQRLPVSKPQHSSIPLIRVKRFLWKNRLQVM